MMESKIITIDSGKITDYLHHVDLREFGTRRVLTCFVAEFDNCNIILDCVSSLEIKHLLRYAKRNKIDLSKVKYLVTTHHHFDHTGGMWKLYEEIKKYNPEIKIITNQETKTLLNDYEYHLSRAKRTFGDFIGEMRVIEEDAFKIIESSMNFNADPNKLDVIETFQTEGIDLKLSILKTPGHTHDHQCPLFIKDGEIDFIFFGEAVGTLYHSTKLVSMPTSMPVYFNYEDYMNTLQNLKEIYPLRAGMGHFGVINGKDNVRTFLLDNESFMKKFKDKIVELYAQRPETKYIVPNVLAMLAERTDLMGDEHPVLRNIILGITYGMMMSLGYRKE